LWIHSWHTIEKGSQEAGGFGPISSLFTGLSVAAVAVALWYQAMSLSVVLEQEKYNRERDERARVNQAEEFARSFMSKDMRDSRGQAWRCRSKFLQDSPQERVKWAENWFAQKTPDTERENWSTETLIDYYTWVAIFCETLPNNRRNDFARKMALQHYWHWWRGYILILARYVEAHYETLTRGKPEEKGVLPMHIWITTLRNFDQRVFGSYAPLTNIIEKRDFGFDDRGNHI